MKTWIRRNGRPLLVSVLTIVLIAITITRPAWQDNIGNWEPQQTVPFGHSTVLGGIRWQLTSVKEPTKQELQQSTDLSGADDDDVPPNSRLVAFVWQRSKDGKPASIPAGFTGCSGIAVAGKRQWTRQSVSIGVISWTIQRGYTNVCSPKYTEPMVQVFIIPTDVHITAIDLQFLPESWSDTKQLAKSSDVLVVRFNTG
jgi:hypothetical protein